MADYERTIIGFSLDDVIHILEHEPVKPDIMNRGPIAHLAIEREAGERLGAAAEVQAPPGGIDAENAGRRRQPPTDRRQLRVLGEHRPEAAEKGRSGGITEHRSLAQTERYVDLAGSHHSWMERGMVGARSVCLSGYHRQPFLEKSESNANIVDRVSSALTTTDQSTKLNRLPPRDFMRSQICSWVLW